MSYKITVWVRPSEQRYPFALNTEADQIPLTVEELEELQQNIASALANFDHFKIARAQHEQV